MAAILKKCKGCGLVKAVHHDVQRCGAPCGGALVYVVPAITRPLAAPECGWPELAKLFTRLRQAQRDYFATRSHEVLVASKDLERQVDMALNAMATPQKKLF